MKRSVAAFAVVALVLGANVARGEDQKPGVEPYPKPKPFPASWELKFKHSRPKRIVIETPGRKDPVAYWYMPYTVTNTTGQERMFLPSFLLVTNDGKVVKSDQNLPPKVFDKIKEREANRFMEPAWKVAGLLRQGPDQAKDGVAIWPEPSPEMGKFSIFVSGLSGETARVKDAQGKEQILFKTLQLNYIIRGDDVYPGEDAVNENPSEWVMR